MADDFRHLRLDRDARGVATVTLRREGLAGQRLQRRGRSANSGRSSSNSNATRRGRSCSAARSRPGSWPGRTFTRFGGSNPKTEVRAVLAAGHELFDRVERLALPHGRGDSRAVPGRRAGVRARLPSPRRPRRRADQNRLARSELGLIPGWGGTQRLPRLVGLRQALRMILEGSTLCARRRPPRRGWSISRRRPTTSRPR